MEGAARRLSGALTRWRARHLRLVFASTALVVPSLAATAALLYAAGATATPGTPAPAAAVPGPATVPANERAAYNEPPPTPDPATPGTWISTGADETDPFMVVEGGDYYLFTSRNAPDANIPVRSATIVGQWGPVTDALPDLPAWAAPGWAWAPDVQRFGDHYVLYFTTLLRGVSPPTMCIGAAVGTSVSGPYTAQPAPFICQTPLGGSIDPRVFVGADGSAYMLWKSDENALSQTTDTRIYSQPLTTDGLRLVGRPRQIFAPDQPWQGFIVEAPQLLQVEGVYYLFYSGFWFNQPGYAIGVARCAGPLGPCADTSPEPLLGSNAQGEGPGEASVFSDARGVWLLYAPFHSAVPLTGPPRPATTVRLGFGPDGVYVAATPGTPAAV